MFNEFILPLEQKSFNKYFSNKKRKGQTNAKQHKKILVNQKSENFIKSLKKKKQKCFGFTLQSHT